MVLEVQLENPSGQQILDIKLQALAHTDHQATLATSQSPLETRLAQCLHQAIA
jgi:hypothetical protein